MIMTNRQNRKIYYLYKGEWMSTTKLMTMPERHRSIDIDSLRNRLYKADKNNHMLSIDDLLKMPKNYRPVKQKDDSEIDREFIDLMMTMPVSSCAYENRFACSINIVENRGQ